MIAWGSSGILTNLLIRLLLLTESHHLAGSLTPEDIAGDSDPDRR